MTGVLLAACNRPLDPEDLTPGEAAQLATVPGAARRRSWLVARRALKQALTSCGLPADTSVHALPSPTVSLSHSAELAVAAVPVGGPVAGDVVGVGVDIELDRRPDPRTAPFFLTTAERRWLARIPAGDRPRELLRLWTVKESLFKADPGNATSVLRDYAVVDPGARRGSATRGIRDGPRLHYTTIALRRGALSVAMALSPSGRRHPMRTVEFEHVAKRISEVTAVPVERLTSDVTVAELLPDSFMFIEVAVDLQEEFGIVIAQADFKDVRTLGDLVALVQHRVEEGRS